jgi:hypothetical protein
MASHANLTSLLPPARRYQDVHHRLWGHGSLKSPPTTETSGIGLAHSARRCRRRRRMTLPWCASTAPMRRSTSPSGSRGQRMLWSYPAASSAIARRGRFASGSMRSGPLRTTWRSSATVTGARQGRAPRLRALQGVKDRRS